MTQEQTWWAVFDKDGNFANVTKRLFNSEVAAIYDATRCGNCSWLDKEAQGYYAAPAKIVEVK